MNLISIILLTLFEYFSLPFLWNIAIEGFPGALKNYNALEISLKKEIILDSV